MIRKHRHVLAWVVVLVLAMMVSVLGGCTAEPTVSGPSPTPDPNKLENPNVSILFADPGEFGWAAWKAFEDKYDAKVNLTAVAFDQFELKTLAMMSAGTAPDVIYLHSWNFPRVAIMNIVQPVDSYVDMKDPFWATNAQDYSWGGKHFGLATTHTGVLMFFNKTLFEDNGLTTPLELYNEGKWNWDTFREAAMALTQDTNGDGKSDIWGYGGWMYDIFVLSNDGRFVTYNDNGTIDLTLDDPNTVKGLQFMQDGYFKDKYVNPSGNVEFQTQFPQGKMAMTAANASFIPVFKASMKDEMGIVPFPKGPDNKSGAIAGNSDSWGICTGAKNPKGAVLFLRTQLEYGQEHKKESPVYAGMSDDDIKIVDEAAKNINVPRYTGIGNFWPKSWPFWDQIFAGTPVATLISEFKPVFQNEIDLTLKNTEPPKVEPFLGVKKIDFEDGTLDWISTKPKDGEGAGLLTSGITTDAAEAIEGKSYKVTIDPEAGYSLIARTLPAKWDIKPMHYYTVTVDYRALADMNSDGFLYACIRPEANITDGKVSFGWITKASLKKGEKGTLTGTLFVNEQAKDLCLVIAGFLTPDIVIDNIDLVEQ